MPLPSLVRFAPVHAKAQVWAAGKHKRRINCGAWSYQNQLAYGSDDKQISVTSETGQIQDQVRVSCLSCLSSFFRVPCIS